MGFDLAKAERWLVAGCFAALAGQLAYGVVADGLTNDEVLYVAAGARHLRLGDDRLDTTAPPLAPLVAAAGLTGIRLQWPALAPREDAVHWSYRFLFAENDADVLILRARLPFVALTLAWGALVWVWARQAGGPVAGLAAIALFSFHPSLLAHGHLATTDACAAAFMTLGSWAFWRWSRANGPGLGWVGLTGLGVGLAAASRLTGWLLAPALAGVWLLGWRAACDERRGGDWLRRSRALALGVLLPPLCIWAGYGFRASPWGGERVLKPIGARLGAGGAVVAALARAHAFPETYLEGIRYQIEHARSGHPAYLLGSWSHSGWRLYPFVALAVKNTPGFLAAALGTVALCLRRRGALAAHTLLPAGTILTAVALGHIDIGERYLLPLYPSLIVLAATQGAALAAGRSGRLTLAALAMLHVGPTLLAAPAGYLAYFNVLAGGTAGGHGVLIDSNLDWGQDLPRLASWMRAHGVGRVQLGYDGADDPDRWGIAHEDLPGDHLYPARGAVRPFDGVVVVSPNLLLGLFPRLGDPYAALRARAPDDRAGVFFVYRMGGAIRNSSASVR